MTRRCRCCEDQTPEASFPLIVETTNCLTCPTSGGSAPKRWELAIAGVTDGDCITCDPSMNGVFTLHASHVPGGCRWFTTGNACSCTTCPSTTVGGTRYSLTHSTGDGGYNLSASMRLGGGSGTLTDIAKWFLATTSWDCHGENTLVGGPVAGGAANTCLTWPTSVLLEPSI